MQKKDLLQLTIDAHVEDEGINVAGTDTTSSFQSLSQTKKTLTDEDIVAVATDFILAGYETTANTLGYTSYLLALNPDKQDKLYNEINAYFDEHEVLLTYTCMCSRVIICSHVQIVEFVI